jgi:adenylate kinase family enzyme
MSQNLIVDDHPISPESRRAPPIDQPRHTQYGRRVLVIGTSGSGKTTLGRCLAANAGVPFVETDALCHGPNWTEVGDDVLKERLETAMRSPGWVIDNGYPRKAGDIVLHHADTVIWIDLPLAITEWRLIRRSLRNILRAEDLWNGNRQTVRRAFWGRDSLAAWGIRTHFDLRRSIPDRINRAPNTPNLVRLRSRRQVASFLRHPARVGYGGGEPEPVGRKVVRGGLDQGVVT